MGKTPVSGSNIKDVRNYNRGLVLKLICTNPPISRSQLAQKTRLAKMTLSNIVSELIENGIIREQKAAPTGESGGTIGRKPILLDISEDSPCVCGILIKRGLCQVILADLRGRAFDRIDTTFTDIHSVDELTGIMLDSYFMLEKRCRRKIIAISVSSIGPLDTKKGTILNPTDFYGLTNVPIVDVLSKETGKYTALINDANAGALAEKIYGLGKDVANFVYIHIMNGIGAGIVLDNKLYEGNTGQSCEFGHTSINFAGPKCSCGNHGCIDLYANIEQMKKYTEMNKILYPDSMLFTKRDPGWNDYVDFANFGDPLAMMILDKFCEYISYSLTNLLNIVNANLVLIGYDCKAGGNFIENAIANRINRSVIYSSYHKIIIRHSSFEGDAPLIGSIAAITNKIFNRPLYSNDETEKIDDVLFG